MLGTRPSVRNIKIHFKTSSKDCLLEKIVLCQAENEKCVVYKKNFVIIRTNLFSYVYIIFPAANYINVTGIKAFDQIQDSLKQLYKFLKIERKVFSNVFVDNITASGKFFSRLNFEQIRDKIKKGNNTSVSFAANSNYFPGAFCKLKGIGSMLIFRSGSYSIVGTKSKEEINLLFDTLSTVFFS